LKIRIGLNLNFKQSTVYTERFTRNEIREVTDGVAAGIEQSPSNGQHGTVFRNPLGAIFFNPKRPHRLWAPGSVKRPGHEVDHPRPPGVEITNE